MDLFRLKNVKTYTNWISFRESVLHVEYSIDGVKNLGDVYKALHYIWQTHDFYFESKDVAHYSAIHTIWYKNIKVGYVSYMAINPHSIPLVFLHPDRCESARLYMPHYTNLIQDKGVS